MSESWINTRTVQLQGGEARINEHFLEHPGRVLGELTVGHGMYGADTLSVVGELDAETIAAAIALHGRRIAAAAPTPPSTSDRDAATGVDVDEQQLVEAPEGLWDGHLIARADGGFAEVKDGLEHPIQTPRTIGAELRALLGLRDRARELLAAEAQSLEDTPRIGELRARLRADYESYYARYGPINRFELRRTGRIDPESGEERMARIAPRAITAFRGDPFCPLVMSLEAFDETTQRATPAALLSKRVIAPRAAGARRRDRAGRARGVPGHPRARRDRRDRASARPDRGGCASRAWRAGLRGPTGRPADSGRGVPVGERARSSSSRPAPAPSKTRGWR